MIRVKNQLFEALLFNQSIADFRKDKRVTVKVGLRFSTLFHKLRANIDAYSDERQRLIDKYCDRDSEDNPIEVDGKMQFKQKKKEFNDAWKELIDAEVEVDVERITLNASKELADGIMSIEAMEILRDLIDFTD